MKYSLYFKFLVVLLSIFGCGCSSSIRQIEIEDIKIERLEPYTLEGIVTGAKLYCLPWNLGDYKVFKPIESFLNLNSEVMPIDIAVVTVPHNKDSVLGDFYTIMRDRYAWMLPKHKDVKYPPKEHITNNHLIATDKILNKKIRGLKRGQQIFLKGYLVRITYPNGAQLTSSQSRSDQGYAPVWERGDPGRAGGSCEIILVENLEIKKI